VDELVEEMVDKRPTPRSVSTLAFSKAAVGFRREAIMAEAPITIRTFVLESPA